MTQPPACPWEPFQDRAVLAIFAAHYGWHVADWHGPLGLERRIPVVGSLWGRTWSPESSDPEDWVERICAAPIGHVDVMSNVRIEHPRFQLISPPDLVSSIIVLDPDPDTMLSSFEKRARKAIGRARRGGLIIEPTRNTNDLDEFAALMQRVSLAGARFEIPPNAVLAALLHADLARLYVARWDGAIAGGLVLLGRGAMVHGLVAGHVPDLCNGLPGNLLYWDAMVAESRRGARYFDLGAQRTSELPSVALAKRAWHPIEVPAYRYSVTGSSWRAAVMRGINRLRPRQTP